MSKYLRAYKNSVSAFLQYRLNLVLYSVGHAISLSGLFFLWLTIYQTGGQVGSYSFTEIITYYILISFLRLTINDAVGASFDMIDDIREGRITAFLIKPYSYLASMLANILGRTTVNFTFVLPVTFVFIWIFNFFSVLPNTQHALWFVLFLGIALFMYFLLYALVALCAFWVEQGHNYVYALIVFSNFLNGSLLPLDIFPAWFQNLSNYGPFQFLMYVPIQVFLEKPLDYSNLIIKAGIWLIILSITLIGIFRVGVKKYEGTGI